MSSDRDSLRRIVQQLDEAIPRENARVRMYFANGPDESTFAGTTNGYLRFGVELLKAAVDDAHEGDPSRRVRVDVEDLIVEDSDISFDEFILDESLELPGGRATIRDNVMAMVMGIGCVTCIAMMIVGFVAVIAWLVRTFT